MSVANKRTAYSLAIALALSAAVIVLASFRWKPEPQQPPAQAEPLPSVTAIQRRLNELEPENPLKVDGKLGRATQEKWDRVFIRESAKAAFEAAGGFEKGK